MRTLIHSKTWQGWKGLLGISALASFLATKEKSFNNTSARSRQEVFSGWLAPQRPGGEAPPHPPARTDGRQGDHQG